MVLKITIFIRLYNILLIHNAANHSPIAVMFFQVFSVCEEDGANKGEL